MTELKQQVVRATRWSTITEVIAKLVTPISSMVLARLLTPNDFGVMVTAIMVISFAEIFTDAGFQKYIIQQPFKSQKMLHEATNVAFISNLCLSIVIWVIIIIFCQPIAELVGNKGRGDVIAVSCICIPLSAFSSIQMALYKRNLNFKVLFWVRSIGVLIPLIVTIPLALLTHSYWSLIMGMITLQISNAIILTCKSKWKPKLWYDWELFKCMFAFSAWSMLEALSIWLTNYCDIFIVGTILNDYYLGLYRTSMTTVGQIMGIISSATTSVLYSSLSKVQDDNLKFIRILFRFQKIVSIILMPMSVGIFVFRNLITDILLGAQWHEAAWFIGIWGLTSGVIIVLSYYCSEVLRAKGKPKLSTLSQLFDLIILLPIIWYGVHQSFEILCDLRAVTRIFLIIPILIITHCSIKISTWKMIYNIRIPIMASIIMGLFGCWYMDLHGSIISEVIDIILCIIIYLLIIILIPSTRKDIIYIKSLLVVKK